MPDETAPSEQNYDSFVQRIAETGVIWALRSEKDGWANCESNEYEDTDVILFWSDRGRAMAHIRDEWRDHTPVEVGFDDFIDAWLQGMDGDGVLAGLDWNQDLNGPEVEPKELADRLLDERGE